MTLTSAQFDIEKREAATNAAKDPQLTDFMKIRDDKETRRSKSATTLLSIGSKPKPRAPSGAQGVLQEVFFKKGICCLCHRHFGNKDSQRHHFKRLSSKGNSKHQQALELSKSLVASNSSRQEAFLQMTDFLCTLSGKKSTQLTLAEAKSDLHARFQEQRRHGERDFVDV